MENIPLNDEVTKVLIMEEGSRDNVMSLLDTTEDGKTRSTIDNLVIILKCDPEFRGRIRLNKFTNMIEISDSTWDRHSTTITDTDMSYIRSYIEQHYHIHSAVKCDDAIRIVANDNAYHPIMDKLDSLVWDGVNRIDTLLPKYLGTEDNSFTHEATHLLLMAMLMRLFYPGCKFDLLFCLVGPQGIGKSTFFRFLALNDEWFSDDVKSLSGKTIYEDIASFWLVELSEMLATANAKSIEEIKAFITRQKDTYRIPYDKYSATYARSCVFVGTTNNIDCLPLDRTGNRRFVPILCSEERVCTSIYENEDEARVYFEQIWAEAMEEFNCIADPRNHRLVFSQESEIYLAEMRREYTPEDIKKVEVCRWLDGTTEEYVCTSMILEKVFGRNFLENRIETWESKEIGQIMDSLSDWKRVGTHKFGTHYGTQRAWRHICIAVPTDEIEDLPFE